ncbi:hypothetical protein XF_2610 [Xylella fastidiosa 9a5c]|uniref:Uncharacterized protein n=1 Tax=Xylella fastidiosa (strain 9a5c) TaxID=160492 RepID=Q9PAA8_XYLFA|nr:hypothetical protein XF_2610 [Xylella fastidiosa 9a5c]
MLIKLMVFVSCIAYAAIVSTINAISLIAGLRRFAT